MIPKGIPFAYMIVKNGSGGPNKDSIPVREDLNGPVTGYLKNGTQVRIVSTAYPGISKYRKTWNNTLWVSFDVNGKDLITGKEGWCELTGHLEEVVQTTDGEYELRFVKVGSDWSVKLVKSD